MELPLRVFVQERVLTRASIETISAVGSVFASGSGQTFRARVANFASFPLKTSFTSYSLISVETNVSGISDITLISNFGERLVADFDNATFSSLSTLFTRSSELTSKA